MIRQEDILWPMWNGRVPQFLDWSSQGMQVQGSVMWSLQLGSGTDVYGGVSKVVPYKVTVC